VVTLARDGRSGPVLALDAQAEVTGWIEGLTGIDAIVHLAGIAHRVPDARELEQINVAWPLRLFEAAAAAGIRDFVFLSSIKVLGDVSERPLREDDAYAATDAYGRSKVLAEQGLLERHMHLNAQIRLAILRPPLVYGPGVKANFRTLARWAGRGRRGLILPFGAARAPRSLISVSNLCDAIVACLGRSGIFHCADPADTSVAELFGKLGVPRSRLVPVPVGVMRAVLTLVGRASVFQRLYEPLQVDSTRSRLELGWQPEPQDDAAMARLGRELAA
jgi:nucleoside-diphosphate-sugar epimerase